MLTLVNFHSPSVRIKLLLSLTTSAGVRLVFMTKSVTAWAGGRGGREVEEFRNLLEVSYSSPFPTQVRMYADRKGEGFMHCLGFSAHEGEIKKVSVKRLGWTSGNMDQRGNIC